MSRETTQKLDVKASSQQSPYLEKCCLLLSANASYARAAEDLQLLTGMAVSHSTQQRLVHRQSFDLPQAAKTVEEMSVDGGKVRLRTPKESRVNGEITEAVICMNSVLVRFFRTIRVW